ncbi:tetratricopeptide repeat protein [Baaleninema simplex]|uniref:tetratricopeptide repeat protein n=1 Tax=Baaleninema simplex TaxID=2862350 RepID=UPI000344C33F|nr:tetratricopeptide repeat protein [Baaleninema simplex]
MSDPSIDRVAEAFEQRDFKRASKLLKQLKSTAPHNPWVRYYIGRLYEENQRFDTAETVYRQLLRDSPSPKLIDRARQGLQRLEEAAQQQRQQEIERILADPKNAEAGALVLEATPPERRQEFAQHLARIFNADPYSARLMLQSRGWRLYRTGAVGELQLYVKELKAAEIPAFAASIAQVGKLEVLRGVYFESLSPQPIVVCRDRGDRLGKFRFSWEEVRQQVRGGVPIFVNAVSYDISRKTEEQVKRKVETRDFAQVCDLHLPRRRCILRLCDRSYDFQQGVIFTPEQQQTIGKMRSATTRINWNGMIQAFDRLLPEIPVWSDFSQFAETAIDYDFLLEKVTPYVDIPRSEPTNWDPAFQLYSGLVFLRNFGAAAS